VPNEAMASALDWLVARDDRAGILPAAMPEDCATAAQFLEDGTPLRECAAFLDPERIVFGIVSEPATPTKAATDVVLLLNSGTIHHIGPSRLYVTIARDCAARGTPAIRLDLSGVGDSGLRAGEKENSPYADSARLDVREAVDFATKRYPGARVHIIGLCSGAYHGFKAAAAGLPLSSIAVVNPLTFFWQAGMSLEYADFQVTAETTRYARSSRNLSSWLKLLRGQVDLRVAANVFWKRIQVRTRNSLRGLARFAKLRLQNDLAYELQDIAGQCTEIYFIFSASDPGHSMLLEQGGRIVGNLARSEKLRISIVQGADHTFTSHWNRDQLQALLAAHLDRHAGRA